MKSSNSDFLRRTANIFNNQKRRARAEHRPLDYTLEELRALVFRTLEAGFCPYCGGALDACNFGCDHGNPTSRTRDFALANLVICCERCNQIKGNMNEQEFGQLLQMIRAWPPEVQASLLARLRAGGRLVRR